LRRVAEAPAGAFFVLGWNWGTHWGGYHCWRMSADAGIGGAVPQLGA
jgi:hypothetical protein